MRSAKWDRTVTVEPPRGSAAPTFRLHEAQTGKEIVKISTAAAAQRDPAPGCIHVQNYGEQARLADALLATLATDKRVAVASFDRDLDRFSGVTRFEPPSPGSGTL